MPPRQRIDHFESENIALESEPRKFGLKADSGESAFVIGKNKPIPERNGLSPDSEIHRHVIETIGFHVGQLNPRCEIGIGIKICSCLINRGVCYGSA